MEELQQETVLQEEDYRINPEEQAKIAEEVIDGQEGAADENDIPRSNPEDQQPTPEKISKEDQKEGKEKAENLSDDKKAEIEKLMAHLPMPKGVEYIVNKNDELRFIVPINGRKYSVSPDELFSGFNLNQAGQQNLQQAKNLQNELKSYFGNLKENPGGIWDLAKKLGHNPDELAKALLLERAKELNMSDEEREMVEWQKKKENEKKEYETYRQKREQAEFEDKKNQYLNEVSSQLTEAMKNNGFSTSTKGIKSNIMVSALSKMQAAERMGQTLSADSAVKQTKMEWKDSVVSVFDELDDNQIVKLLPESIIKAIHKADLQKFTETPSSNSIGGKVDMELMEDEQAPKQRKKMPVSDFFHNLK